MSNEAAKWLVEGRTGYTLIHHGWAKGEEQFRNQYWFGLQYDYKTVTEAEAEEKAAFIVKAVNSHDLFVKAAKAALAYDEAIHSCADDPNKMSSFCTAEGDDLDTLYFNWLEASKAALAAAGEA